MIRHASGATICFSGQESGHYGGVALIINKKITKTLIDWEPINARIIRARFNFKYTKLTIIQCYAPTEDHCDEDKETVRKTPKDDVMVVMGDMNAKIGINNTGRERVTGKEGLGKMMNDNGERFADFCMENDLIFKHMDIHKETWVSPTGKTKNQIDHITINRKWRTSLQGVKRLRDPVTRNIFEINLKNSFKVLEELPTEDIESGWTQFKQAFTETSSLVLGQKNDNGEKFADFCMENDLIFKHKDIHKETWVSPTGKTKNQIDHITINRKWRTSLQGVKRLRDPVTRNIFEINLKNSFEVLEEPPTEDIESGWTQFKQAFTETSSLVLGEKKKAWKTWVTPKSWNFIEERKKLKQKILSRKENFMRDKTYKRKNKQVKKSVKEDKQQFVEEQAEKAANRGDLCTSYKITKSLIGSYQINSSSTVKGKDGTRITKQEEVSKSEVKQAIQKTRNWKAPGEDKITGEMIKASIDVSSKALRKLLNRIWEEEEEVPEDWKSGIIVKIPKKGDSLDCNNWRGITLLSIPGKIFSRIILERMKTSLERVVREEQASFRKERGAWIIYSLLEP
ncbi:uncharacterized protein LOC117107507 [Anneissia japonica]|uniref:uncharacterized protein LOC117107507 n=1 Tax=Anneissia japonica TaxID=1529436 RepID=UPI0014256503|nr:uncharacterized protein LOC117107507 [Anneissia japonica]